jgi:hypothetical protein
MVAVDDHPVLTLDEVVAVVEPLLDPPFSTD